jgi:plasmid stabilization system protein ParE
MRFSIIGILSDFPFIGPAYPRGASGPLRQIVFRSYRIFYDADEGSGVVSIMHVRHGARSEPSFDE